MKTRDIEIRKQSKAYKRVQNLMHNVNAETLAEAYKHLDGKKAVGVDGITKDEYGADLMNNINTLLEKMKKFQYKPQPSKRVYIPKANGKLRPLGIPSFEDKMVQRVMADLLNDVYEPRFLDCSYGFREKRSCHDVIRYIDHTIMTEPVNYILEADIKGFFDHMDHKLLMEFLNNDIDDTNFLRYITRFLKAGIIEGTEWKELKEGSIQGGLISPVCANVYLHYVLDTWFERLAKPHLRGKAFYVRYADDFLVMFQYKDDAERVMRTLPLRLGKYNLELAEDKTRILKFGRHDDTNATFDFLGFRFYGTKTRKGYYRVGVQTSPKKLKKKREEVKVWIFSRINKPMEETWATLRRKFIGHNNYYGVSGNLDSVRGYREYLKKTMLAMIRRRGQKHKMTWKTFLPIWDRNIPEAKITVNIWSFGY